MATASLTPFQEAVCRTVRQVPAGRVISYGGVAALMGAPRAARGVGSALCALEDGTDVPWWRVVNREGRISTTCIDHTCRLQRALLEAEGIPFDDHGCVSLDEYGWNPHGSPNPPESRG